MLWIIRFVMRLADPAIVCCVWDGTPSTTSSLLHNEEGGENRVT